MRVRKTVIGSVALTCLLLAALLPAAGASGAVPGPAWQLDLIPMPTTFQPGTIGGDGEGTPRYRLVASNVGGGPTSGSVTLTVSLPPGLAPAPEPPVGDGSDGSGFPPPSCDVKGQVVTCSTTYPVYPGRWLGARLPLEVTGDPGPLSPTEARVEGGGAVAVTTTDLPVIGTEPQPFGFLTGRSGFGGLLTAGDGSVISQAGGRPDRLTVNFAFPTVEKVPGRVISDGHLRDLVTDLPPGLVVNPNATAVRCTEAQLVFSDDLGGNGCPPGSQVGNVLVMTETGGPQVVASNLYNMVPPPGAPAELGFQGLPGLFIHVIGKVRSDGDYGLSAVSNDILARTNNPVFTVRAQLWGDPTASSNDELRGKCKSSLELDFCPVPLTERTDRPFLTMPSACSGPLATAASADSWEDPGKFVRREAQSTDTVGNPVGVNGCSLLEFDPSLTLKPDTGAAESPTGISVDLHIPQNEGKDELATSNLKDVVAALPAGMAVNPASAAGLDACTPTQVGLTTPVGQADPIHFTNAPDNCPDAAKIGSVEVMTPLLDHPLPGAVYVAQPQQNPFGTLLAIYVSIKSPADGVYAKLAGKVEADPNTGQLTTTFTENPELPVEDFKLDFFGGPRAALRTPSDCGSYATTSVLTPWSGNPPAHTSDDFQVSSGPSGGACTSSESQRPNAPGFEAGTRTPIAATYSPFVMNLRRSDGQQLLKGLDLTLPPGLSGKLAGVATCSDQAIAAAASKSGREELTNPSCPASSQVGEVTVGAGAGSQPYYTKGTIYLAGPYEGAPISFAIVTPAVAGPYDLGDVVTRAAAHVDPITTQISVHSDPLPTILQGIPLQLRDVRVDMGRSQFTLNPTSCERMQLTGTATSALGQGANLSNPFQVGGCKGLDFAPKLTIRLKGKTKRGGNPALTATLTAKEGEANIASASVSLPHSEFLDQAHIRTVCTRVQFNAGPGHGAQCPKGSVYGYARALTPLLDDPLEGPVFMRSSDHPLPDLVAALNGQIDVVLAGRIDSYKGGIRNTFDVVPDAPVSKFVLQMQGGKRGLLQNSTNICRGVHRATVRFTGHNGAVAKSSPAVKALKCPKQRKQAGHAKKKSGRK